MRRAILFAAALAMLGLPGARPAPGAEALNTSTFYTYEPIAITENQPLDFGRVIRPSGSAASVVVSESGDTSASTITLVDGQQPGSYAFSGDMNATGIAVSVAVDTSTYDTGCDQGWLSAFAVTPDAAGPALISGSSGTVSVGGSVTVATTASGTATCYYTVTASYP